MKKRIRSVNYTVQETELLISLIESKIDIIECKKCDSVTWQEKEFAWKSIETDFNRLNSNGEVFRDAKCLRLKFDSLKRDTRKKERIIQYERYNLGSSSNKRASSKQNFTELEKKVKDMIVTSFERQESLSDSDPADVKNFSFELPPVSENNEEPTVEDERFENIDEYDEVDEKPFQLVNSNVSDDICAAAETTETKEINNHSRMESSSEVTSKTHSALGKNKLKKRKLPDGKLAEARLEFVNLQKQLTQQAIKKEIVQTKVLQLEYEHKRQIQELERQHLLLKMQLTKIELENAKQSKNIIKLE